MTVVMNRYFNKLTMLFQLCILIAACECGETSLLGSPDALQEISDQVEVDIAEEIVPDRPCWDNDGDGFMDAACGGLDCDDTRDDVYPGAPEVCNDDVDQNCDGRDGGPFLLEPCVRVRYDRPVESPPRLAWTGITFGVIWTEHRGISTELMFSLISAAGERLGEPFQVSDDGGAWASEPSITWTGSEFGIVWTEGMDSQNVFFTRIGSSGERMAAPVPVTEIDYLALAPDVAWTGSEYGLVWADTRLTQSECTMMGCYYHVFFTRLDEAGNKLTDEIPVSDDIVSPGGQWDRTWISWTGSEFGVFWNHLSRVTPSGMDTDDVFLGHEFSGLPVWAGSQYGVLWKSFEGDPEGRYSLFLTLLLPDGTETQTVSLESSSVYYEGCALAWAGSGYGVAWKTEELSARGIYFTLLAETGDEEFGKVKILEYTDYLSNHALAWTGSEFGLVWRHSVELSADVYFGRIGLCE